MTWYGEAPGVYENATEDNPHRFGLNSRRNPSRSGPGMWETTCDGIPTLMGCGNYIEHSVPFVKASRKRKPSGWLIIHGRDDDDIGDDKRIVLAFCPKCADVVEEQERKRGRP